MKTISRICSIALLVCILLVISSALAEGITPRADTEFASAYPTLTSSKSVSFKAITTSPKSSISVTACWLEKKIGTTWSEVCSLTPPSYIAQNGMVYNSSASYSSQIGTGTYRVWATFNADGHEITRCSNEKTF